MILLLQPNQFTLASVSFLEKKVNMIMDGFFSKLSYSDECMTMNGLFMEIPINILSYSIRNILQFDSNINKDWIYKLSLIEKQIIQYYMFFFGVSNKTPLYSLKMQLQNGTIKYYSPLRRSDAVTYYIKISGIWENSNEIGITYKIIEC
jgi:hypothetical protein